jgi:hypothetical protein
MEQSFLHLSVISEFGVISVIQTLVERKNVESRNVQNRQKNKKQNIGRKVILKDVG